MVCMLWGTQPVSLLAGLYAQFSQYSGNKQTPLSVAEKEPLFFLLDSSVPTLLSAPFPEGLTCPSDYSCRRRRCRHRTISSERDGWKTKRVH